MSLVNLAASTPWPLVAAVLSGNVIPYLAALATRAPSWLTGVLSAALSFVAAVCAEVANVSGAIDWRAVLATAGATWLVAAVHHSKILKGTPVEAKLHAAGAGGDAGAVEPVALFAVLALILFIVLLVTGHWLVPSSPRRSASPLR